MNGIQKESGGKERDEKGDESEKSARYHARGVPRQEIPSSSIFQHLRRERGRASFPRRRLFPVDTASAFMGKSPAENFRDFIDASSRVYTCIYICMPFIGISSVRSLTHAADRLRPRGLSESFRCISVEIIEGNPGKISRCFDRGN